MKRPLLVMVTILNVCSCARILAIIPFFGRSINIYNKIILHTLAQRGHQVVEYSPFPLKHPHPNHTHVEVHTSDEEDLSSSKYEDFVSYADSFPFFGQEQRNIVYDLNYKSCNGFLSDEKVKKLLKSDEHFDLVLTASTFAQESMLLFGHKFKAPTITLQCHSYSSILNNPSGNVVSIATIPDHTSFGFTNKMSFIERFRNFVSVTKSLIEYYQVHLPKHDAIMKYHYKEDNLPPVAEMVRNISLTFINAHATAEYPIPYTPNIVPISGITIARTREPLTQDVKAFIDGAKNGLIYFSFGTTVPLHTFPAKFLNNFLNAFKRLPERVLWKFGAESLDNLPSNVMLVKWAPQLSILEHPNCKLFITHGGAFSLHEAMNVGVPTVGIPFFTDQPYNIKLTEAHGTGISLEVRTLSEEGVYNAIRTVIDNAKYKENAQRLSRIFKDRPMSPADSVIYWVEYVLRHAGAHHLRPASALLPWYQLALLDVLAAAIIPIILFFVLFYLIIKKSMHLLLEFCTKMGMFDVANESLKLKTF